MGLISIELLRNETELVREGMRRRGDDIQIERLLDLDERRRSSIAEGDALKARRNEVSKHLGQVKERPPELIEEMREVGARIKSIDVEVRSIEEDLNRLLLDVPNIPRDDVPVGEDETGNAVVRTVGEPGSFPFEPRPHWELGEALGIIDLERGAKLSGSRFFVLKGAGSRLQRALISWMLDLHVKEHGYDEVYLPYLVSRGTAIGSGHLPKFADTMYHDEEDDLWLVPTAEMPITNLYRDEILPPGTLPVYLVAHTPSFRREKAAAGRDTRGIKRVHQFEKVEMYKFVEPEQSDAELDKLVADASNVCAHPLQARAGRQGPVRAHAERLGPRAGHSVQGDRAVHR